MPPRRQRYGNNQESSRFETEALSFMNKDQKPNKKIKFNDSDSESEPDIGESDHSDVEETLSDQEEAGSGSDSDDAPEDVGFTDSRQSVLAQLRTVMKQIDTDKQAKKDKRKKLDAQFKEQKNKKIQELEASRLPADILEGLEDEIPTKKRKIKQKKKKKEKKALEDVSDEVLRDAMLDDDDILGDSLTLDPTHPAGDMGDDYIAFTDSASGVQVADVRHIEKKSLSLAQSAADFRQSRLYGKGVRRESNTDRLAKAEKRRNRTRR